MRRAPLVGLVLALVVAACSPSPSGGPVSSTTGEPYEELLTRELTDVRSGETFTLRELAADGPVLVETMAVWCVTCLQQQRQVVRAHEALEFRSVGIDVDPNEDADDLAAYADREGFDWRFAVADGELVRLLTDRYGFVVTNPPSTPTFVVEGDRIRALETGRIRSADELIDELGG